MEERYQSNWTAPARLSQRVGPPRQSYVVIGEKGGKHEVDIKTLRMWALEGLITPGNQVYSSLTESWAVAGELPELSDVFAAARSASSPPAKPKRSFAARYMLACLGVVAALFVGRDVSSTSDTSATPSSSVTPSRNHITKSGYAYCLKADDFKELTRYLVRNDRNAAGQMMADGGCGLLPAGIEVDVTDTNILNGMVQIRRLGSRQAFWTNLEAI